jgi:hypothetical protein
LGEGIILYLTHRPCGHLESLFFIPFGDAEWGLKFHLIQSHLGCLGRTPAVPENDAEKWARTGHFACMTMHVGCVKAEVGSFFDHQA